MALSHFSMSGAVRSTSGPHHPVVLPSSRRSCFGLRPAGAATTDHQKRLVVSLRSEPLSSGGGGSSLDTEVVATVGQVTEVNKDTFWSIVNSAGDKIVVLDMYTQWCGPCKVMAPKFQHLAEKYDDVVFLKLDCNQDNRPLAKELGIKLVPTFKILKDSKIVKEVTGAKLDDLVVAIDTVRSG